MDLDLCCVASFLALLEEGHYGRAAHRLNVTTPALTKRIQRLEREVGVQLIVRDGARMVGANAAGLRFAEAAGPLLAQARAARAVARAELPRLSVRLGVLGRVGDTPPRAYLRILVQHFRRCHPDVGLTIRPIPYSDVGTALLTGDVDVLWGVTSSSHPSLELTHLINSRRAALVSLEHPASEATELTVADVVSLPITYNPAISLDWMTPLFLGDVRPTRDARLVPIDALDASSVLRHTTGRAVTIVAECLMPPLWPTLRVVPVTGLPTVPYYAARRRCDQRGPVCTLTRLLALTAQHLPRELATPTCLNPAVGSRQGLRGGDEGLSGPRG